MAEPADLPLWATTAVDIEEPADAYKQAGWLIGQKPPAEYFNWWMNNVYLWIDYFRPLMADIVTNTSDIAALDDRVVILEDEAADHEIRITALEAVGSPSGLMREYVASIASLGGGTNVSATGGSQELATLSEDRIVMSYNPVSAASYLRAYDYNRVANTFTALGSAGTLIAGGGGFGSGINNYYTSTVALTPTRVAVLTDNGGGIGTNYKISVWDLNTTTFVWTMVGTPYAANVPQDFPRIVVLNSNTIVVAVPRNPVAPLLTTLTFNGSVWSVVGTPYVGTYVSTGWSLKIQSVNQTTMVISSNVSSVYHLETLKFNGTTWAPFGNELMGVPMINCTTIEDNLIAIQTSSGTLQAYRYDNSQLTWVAEGTAASGLTNTNSYSGLTTIKGGDMAFVDQSTPTLRVYRPTYVMGTNFDFMYDFR